MDLLLTIIYFIIAIGILVLVHEFGHFITARLSGMRTEVFAFGMGNRLFGWNKITGFTFGSLPKDFDGGDHCDYRVAAFPIGGYVKVSGMIDESLDEKELKSDPKPWEFRSKNLFQKVLTLSGGVIMNVILAFIIFTLIIYFNGKQHWATTTIGTLADSSIAYDIGLKTGDKILKINDKNITTWDELGISLSIDDMGKNKIIKLLRNGEIINIKVDGSDLIKDLANKKFLGIAPAEVKTYITSVISGKPAESVGLKAGDTIISVNGNNCSSSLDFQKIIRSNTNKQIELTWKRDNEIFKSTITPTDEGIIGVGIADTYTGKIIKEDYGIFTATIEGAKDTYKAIEMIINSFKQLIVGNVSVKQSVGGPIAIAKMASQEASKGFLNFLNFVALLSLMLAIINILPFPALDGGHLVIVLIEGIIRRELPFKLKMAIQQIGMIILLIFMAFVIYIDLTR